MRAKVSTREARLRQRFVVCTNAFIQGKRKTRPWMGADHTRIKNWAISQGLYPVIFHPQG